MNNSASALGYGGVLEGGYSVRENLQPVMRVEVLNTNPANGMANGFALGLNYFIAKPDAKVQFMVQTTHRMTYVRGISEYSAPTQRLTSYILSFQIQR